MMKYILGIMLVTLTSGVSATELTQVTNIGEIWSGYQNGQILFKTDLPHINPAGCSSRGYYIVDADKADANKFLSILLTAQSRNADVRVRISKTLCFSGYPVALRMAIQPE